LLPPKWWGARLPQIFFPRTAPGKWALWRGEGDQESLVRGSGQSPPEAESFLRIRHSKEGTNWSHVRVLHDRNVILGKGALWGEEGNHLGCPRSYKYKAAVCKRNQVDTALHFGMAQSVTDRRTVIIVAIACTAKKIQCGNCAYSLQFLLLNLNEAGGLIVMNVIWSHFLFGTPQKIAS